jgi:hypothetical protein
MLLAADLTSANVPVVVYDPSADANRVASVNTKFRFVDSAQKCIQLSDVVVVATPWVRFQQIPREQWARHSSPRTVVDCWQVERNPHDAAVSHAYYIVREREGETQFCGPQAEEVLTLSTPEAAILAREHWHFLLPCALTVRREVFERVIPIPEVLVFSADGPIATTSGHGCPRTPSAAGLLQSAFRELERD